MKKDTRHRRALSYAEAMYAAAAEKGAEDAVFKDMQIIAAAIEKDKNILKYFSNPLWKLEDKRKAAREIIARRERNEMTLACLTIVGQNNRFTDLEFILREFENVYYSKKNIAKVDVQSAIKLSREQNKRLRKNLEKLFEKKVVVKYTIQPEILGGLLIQCGSYRIDDSIKGKIDRLEMSMKGLK